MHESSEVYSSHMADPMNGPITSCPWCSAALPVPDAEVCPSCGATLNSATGTEPQLPGVTTLDAEAILRARSEGSRPRSRILSFITGEIPVEPAGEDDAASIAPPSDQVRREILRLQVQAEIADLEAETVALKSDTLAQRGIHVSQLGAPEPVAPEDEPDAAPPTETPGA